MDVQVKTTIISVIGTLVAVIIGIAVFSHQVQTENRIKQTITAYSDYIKAVGRCATAHQADHQAAHQAEQAEHQRTMPGIDDDAVRRADDAVRRADEAVRRAIEEETAAKGVIAIYGDTKVIAALAAVGDHLDQTDSSANRFLEAIEVMRQHVGAEQAWRDDLGILLFD